MKTYKNYVKDENFIKYANLYKVHDNFNLILSLLFVSGYLSIHFDLEMYIHDMYKHFLRDFIRRSSMKQNY